MERANLQTERILREKETEMRLASAASHRAAKFHANPYNQGIDLKKEFFHSFKLPFLPNKTFLFASVFELNYLRGICKGCQLNLIRAPLPWNLP